MDALEMEPIGKYKADRNGSAKAAAWRNMVDADLDDVAFLADSDKAREARSLRSAPVAVCSQRRALCLAAVVFSTLFAIALLLVYAAPSPGMYEARSAPLRWRCARSGARCASPRSCSPRCLLSRCCWCTLLLHPTVPACRTTL
ncbi:hypothetical protein JYU34_007957 [Plutella xylostella]|uniref:Uncharacterized protein n=1 Tax=Plutella xylostella TaxID=51655 RepID=A0ABQ7QNH0_PLUXY|nr:hypothetical protein JYU34_007957 [Plutella xylostella]